MAQYEPWLSVNHAFEKSKTANWAKFHETKLTFNTHIDLSYKIAAKRLRTYGFYPLSSVHNLSQNPSIK